MTEPLARFKDLCLDANDPQRVGAFWAAVLGREPADAGQGDGATPDVVLRGEPTIWVNGVPEPKTVKDRVHLDVDLAGPTPQPLLDLGATLLREPEGDRSWWVLADPEGHEFCAFPPSA